MQTKNLPSFSVIIPCFNSSKTLPKAINSVLQQTYDRFEIIVVDDGSTDNTSDVVKAYKDKIRYIRQQNTGVSSARNKGAESATGEWLAFLDADDWYYPERLELHANLIDKHPDVDFLIGDYHYGTADQTAIKRALETNALGKELLTTWGSGSEIILDEPEIAPLIPSYFGHTSTFSLPKKTFHNLGGYSTQFSIGEDLHLLIRLCAISKKLGVISKPMSYYCVHEEGLMRSAGIQAQEKAVETMLSLKSEIKNAPQSVNKGYLECLLNHRFDWSVALIKNGRRNDALKAFLPALLETPSFRCFRLFLSILNG